MYIRKTGSCSEVKHSNKTVHNVTIKYTDRFELEGFSLFPDYHILLSLLFKYFWQCYKPINTTNVPIYINI